MLPVEDGEAAGAVFEAAEGAADGTVVVDGVEPPAQEALASFCGNVMPVLHTPPSNKPVAL